MELRKFIATTVREYLNETKIYQGHKIPVDDVFFHSNPHKGFYDKELLNNIDVFIDDKTFQKNPIEWVDVNKIVPTQVFLSKDNLEGVKKSKKKDNTGAYLVKYNDLFYVIDGHHRIANEIINGVDKIKAFVQYV
jgi:hypothetical protein